MPPRNITSPPRPTQNLLRELGRGFKPRSDPDIAERHAKRSAESYDPTTAQWAAWELERRRRAATTEAQRYRFDADAARAKTDTAFRDRLAEIAKEGRFMSGPWEDATMAALAPTLALGGTALAPLITTGWAGLGAANLLEGGGRLGEGLPGAAGQMGYGALDVATPAIGKGLRSLWRELPGVKPPRPGAQYPNPAAPGGFRGDPTQYPNPAAPGGFRGDPTQYPRPAGPPTAPPPKSWHGPVEPPPARSWHGPVEPPPPKRWQGPVRPPKPPPVEPTYRMGDDAFVRRQPITPAEMASAVAEPHRIRGQTPQERYPSMSQKMGKAILEQKARGEHIYTNDKAIRKLMKAKWLVGSFNQIRSQYKGAELNRIYAQAFGEPLPGFRDTPF
jgi:hypothetical protein